MKIQDIIILLVASVCLVSCDCKPKKTIGNLKIAASGEVNASTNYAAYSQKAAEEGFVNIANMFAAASFSESKHAARHLEELAKLGETSFVPVALEAKVGNTIDNLVEANDGESYEFMTMYPEFMRVATLESVKGALVSFDWANRAEVKHSGFYTEAMSCLNDPARGDAGVAAQWMVCSRCGDTYKAPDLGDSCELCGAPADSFVVFKAASPLL